MNRHLRLETTSHDGNDLGDPGASIGKGTGATAVTLQALPYLSPAPTHRWKHTLALTGTLDAHSAPNVEDEIECLCQEGVTKLTLDLRQLDAIDQRGIEVIASRSVLWEQRGRRFVVLLRSDAIRRALTAAGATDLVTHEPTDIVARRFSRSPWDARLAEVSTTMIIDLGQD
jgi:anti-anti-sigma factor